MKLIRSISAEMMCRVGQYLDTIGRGELFAAMPELSDAIEQLDMEALDLLEAEEEKKDGPYNRLCALLGGSPEAQSLLELTCALLLYPQFGTLLQKWRGHLVTPELACFMENIDEPDYETLRVLYESAQRILYSDQKAEPFYQQEFFADNRLLGYLNGDCRIDDRLEDLAELFDGTGNGQGGQKGEELLPLMIREPACKELGQLLSDRSEDIWLRGNDGIGKRHLLRHALKKCGKSMLFVDAKAILEHTKQEQKLIWLVRREALLLGCDVCIYGISGALLAKYKLTTDQLLRLLAEPFWKEGLRLVFCTDMDVELIPYLDRPIRLLELLPLTQDERVALWERYLDHVGLKLDAVMLGSKYKFSPAQIHKAIRQLLAEADADGTIPDKEVQRILRFVLPPVTTKGSIEPPHENCTMESLVLPSQIKKTIQQICDHVRYSHQVFDEWNMESRFAYGKAVSVLLCGPPGTGKTMTARVLSDELGLPLYHINLSQIVDKYIGETEKHLEEIFSNAEKSNIILFFDEADAVFSKRSEVSDSKDKYANTEISYILQRIEAYDGIVILSTNYMNNIDPAFIRRIQYVLNFHMPGEEERMQLWQSMIPAECPTDQIDFEYLARQFELSGSNIKNAVLAAAFYAAGRGERLGMAHLVYGVRNEFIKQGKPVFAAEFGEYAYFCR
ncbi:MAG: ATP-binding protein [Lachnospiraceae bacterium]|nr:ATP-binding protein [bacterium]MDY5516735.1 ATP-binding protein [Lachnospiraceae bacterium]